MSKIITRRREKRRAYRVLEIDLDSGTAEELDDHVVVAAAARPRQAADRVLALGVGVGALPDEHARDAHMILVGGPHERREAATIAMIHVGVVRQQERDERRVAVLGRVEQWRPRVLFRASFRIYI